MTMNPEDDFVNMEQKDQRITALIDAFMSPDGKGSSQRDRKTYLTMEQAFQIARARAFADSFIVIDEETGEEIEGPLEMVHLICDYLENTAVSVQGKGLGQLESVLTAQMRQQEPSEFEKTLGRLAR